MTEKRFDKLRRRIDTESTLTEAAWLSTAGAERLAGGHANAGRQKGQVQTYDRPYAYRQPIPDDLWIKCPECKGVMFREAFEQNHLVCTHCAHHFRMTAWERLEMICDAQSFDEYDSELSSRNPIQFAAYEQKLTRLNNKTGLREAVITGRAEIHGLPCFIGVMDSRFMMGSMGSVVGEKITRCFERATKEGLPVILFTASGGARMQEGILSLMQMAKTADAVARHHQAGLLYISVMTDPTTGGVTASFASLGDIILSEPGSLIGFAGRRVIEGTISEKLPEDFQRAEFLQAHGFIDAIISRDKLRTVLGDLLTFHNKAADFRKVRIPKLPPVDSQPRKASESLDLIRSGERPVFDDYLQVLFDKNMELHGDRYFSDDPAIWGGLGWFCGQPVTIVGQRKGKNLSENQKVNYGMPHPDGYRKALRLIRQAEKFRRPVLLFVDTPGAYCGVGAEERGIGESIARNLMELFQIKTPLVTVVLSEGGSGGALALAVCDQLGMLSNATYSVISPRGFASLLWKDPSREKEAADAQRMSAADLHDFGVCDKVLPEPGAGAHEDLTTMAAQMQAFFLESLRDLSKLSEAELLQRRHEKFRKLGDFDEHASTMV